MPEASNKESDIVARKVISATEVSSKVYKLTTYKETISNPVHSQDWKEAIEEEIQNLENHHTWEYNHLSTGRKAIGSK